MTTIRIRPALPADTDAMRAILNEEIRTGVNVWHEIERSADGMAEWLAERRDAGMAVTVAEDAGTVIGYAGYGPFRPHSGYALTVEHSLYVAPDHRGKGIGASLLDDLCQRAAAADLHAMIGGIEAGNAASIALHKRFGFEETGRLPEVGRKFDRWLTLVFMQRNFN
jgi:phosphinothricin acetyltransferase